MKKSKFSYDEWECIIDKNFKQIEIYDELLKGYEVAINFAQG